MAGLREGEHHQLHQHQLQHSGSMPALRVVGFAPSVLRVSTMMAEISSADGDRGGGGGYPQLSSPLSQMLITRSAELARDRSSSDLSASSACDFFSREGAGRSADSDGALLSGGGGGEEQITRASSVSSEPPLDEDETRLALGLEHFAAATPIDIPYNLHGVRHWRRCAQKKMPFFAHSREYSEYVLRMYTACTRGDAGLSSRHLRRVRRQTTAASFTRSHAAVHDAEEMPRTLCFASFSFCDCSGSGRRSFQIFYLWLKFSLHSRFLRLTFFCQNALSEV